MGTAFSLYLVFESAGASVGHVGLGYLRDTTASYIADLWVLFVVSACALIASLAIKVYDTRYFDGILNGGSGVRPPFASEGI